MKNDNKCKVCSGFIHNFVARIVNSIKSSLSKVAAFIKRKWKWFVAFIALIAVVACCIVGVNYYKHEILPKKNTEKILATLQECRSDVKLLYIIKILNGSAFERKRLHMSDEGKLGTIAFEELTKLAENGNANAQVTLGLIYHGYDIRDDRWVDIDENEYSRHGDYCDYSYERAAYWYLQAAIQNHGDALFYLGSFYEEGLGVRKNPIKAFFCFRKAYQAKNGYGARSLGDMFRDGIRLNKEEVLTANLDSAMFYWKKAVEYGCEDAKTRIEKIYE